MSLDPHRLRRDFPENYPPNGGLTLQIVPLLEQVAKALVNKAIALGQLHRAVDAVWRLESARIIAGLARLVNDVGLAEELAMRPLAATRPWLKTITFSHTCSTSRRRWALVAATVGPATTVSLFSANVELG